MKLSLTAAERQSLTAAKFEDGKTYLVTHYDGAKPQPIQSQLTYRADRDWFEDEEGFGVKRQNVTEVA